MYIKPGQISSTHTLSNTWHMVEITRAKILPLHVTCFLLQYLLQNLVRLVEIWWRQLKRISTCDQDLSSIFVRYRLKVFMLVNQSKHSLLLHFPYVCLTLNFIGFQTLTSSPELWSTLVSLQNRSATQFIRVPHLEHKGPYSGLQVCTLCRMCFNDCRNDSNKYCDLFASLNCR